MREPNTSRKTPVGKIPNLPDDFPLRLHAATGQWRKTIRGKDYYFGVAQDWQSALQKYQHDSPYIARGETPPPMETGSDYRSMDCQRLASRFIERERQRMAHGAITPSQYNETVLAINEFHAYFGSKRQALSIQPTDWSRFRYWVATAAKAANGEPRNVPAVSTLKKRISYVRAMSNWASDSDVELLSRPLRFGDSFNPVKKAELRKAKHDRRREHGPKMFTPNEIKKILDHLDERASKPGFGKYALALKAAVLLGLNGGYYQSDVATLREAAIDWDKGLIDHYRVKTAKAGVVRIVPMWKRTAEALQAVISLRPKPATPEHEGLVFLTRRGRSYREETTADGKDSLLKINRRDALGEEFSKVLRKLGMKRDGLSFGALRHTFNTVAGEAKDSEARSIIMGHVMDGMQEWYEELGDTMIQRLRGVTASVEQSLFDKPAAPRPRKKPAAVAAPA